MVGIPLDYGSFVAYTQDLGGQTRQKREGIFADYFLIFSSIFMPLQSVLFCYERAALEGKNKKFVFEDFGHENDDFGDNQLFRHPLSLRLFIFGNKIDQK